MDRLFDLLLHASLFATHTPTVLGENFDLDAIGPLPADRNRSLAVWVSISMRAWSLILMLCLNAFAGESRSASVDNHL